MSLEQEMTKMVATSPSGKDTAKKLLTRTARSVFSVLNRAHGDVNDYKTEDSKDAYTYEYAATLSAEYCALDDDAIEDSHSIGSAVDAVVSRDASDDRSDDSNAVDPTAAPSSDCMGTESSDQTVGTAADEMESYQGDGHSPRKIEHQVKANEPWSRAVWAAARDDFAFIVEDSAKLVCIARLRVACENHKKTLDRDKYVSLCLDKAKMIGHKHQDVTVTVKSWKSLHDKEEFDTLEEMRQPWERGATFPEQHSREALRI
jgi:hypothetical protein